MTLVLFDAAGGFLIPLGVAWAYRLALQALSVVGDSLFTEGWVSAATGSAVADAGLHDWALAAGAVVSMAVAIWRWRRRRKRKRALRELGGKVLARLAAIETALRERAAAPRPVAQGNR